MLDGARLTAYDVLDGVSSRAAYANLLLPQLLRERQLDERDAAFAKAIDIIASRAAPLPAALNVAALAERLETATLDEAREIHSFAAGFSTVLQKRRDAAAVQVDAAEVVLWAERRLGDLLEPLLRHQGGRPPKNSDTLSPFQTLDELGVRKKQSERWQTIAGIPRELFTDYLERARHQQKPATQAGLLRIASDLKRAESRQAASPTRSLPVPAWYQ